MSFRGYFVNRDERVAVQFEATYTDSYVQEEVLSCSNEGFDVEDIGVFGSEGVRVVFLRHEDGRPWVYREFYAEKGVDNEEL